MLLSCIRGETGKARETRFPYVYYMSSQKVEDLRAYKVRTVNQTLDEATGMRKKAWRSTMCEQSDFRILVEDDGSESGVIRELIYMVVRFIAWWFTMKVSESEPKAMLKRYLSCIRARLASKGRRSKRA